MQPYPENWLRGLFKGQLYDDDDVSTAAFTFKGDARDDGHIEHSIHWEDDANAIGFTLAMTNPGVGAEQPEIRYKDGVAVISTAFLDHICGLPRVGGALCYERKVAPGNPYHGNLLLKKECPDHVRRKLAANLAQHVLRVEKQPRL